jgi:hypothetical protein
MLDSVSFISRKKETVLNSVIWGADLGCFMSDIPFIYLFFFKKKCILHTYAKYLV